MLLPLLIVVLAVLADQLSKHFLAPFLSALPGKTYPLIEDVLHLTYVENRGAAFGMLADHRWVFMALSVLGLAANVLFYLRDKPANRWIQIAVGLVLGGGIANMIDRLRLGYVVDFIDCRFINFYVFNIADSCVCVGCAIYLLAVLLAEFGKKDAPKKEPAENGGEGSEAGDGGEGRADV